jgi:GAF domain-containing protein
LAKQFGVSDEAIAGLQDPARYPFPPDQKVALLFADAMTRGAGQVGDDLFAEARRHFSEAQIVEIAAVIGLFNYFNRFNNAFHVEITLTDPEVVAHRVDQVAAGRPDPRELCERVVEILAQGRRYFWVGVYQREGHQVVMRAYRGPEPPCHSFRLGEGNVGTTARAGVTKVVDDVSTDPTYKACFAATRSELIVPIVRDGTIVGVIDVESDRVAALGDEDRALVERVAGLIAPALSPAAASP